jgi:hypothetical protein
MARSWCGDGMVPVLWQCNASAGTFQECWCSLPGRGDGWATSAPLAASLAAPANAQPLLLGPAGHSWAQLFCAPLGCTSLPTSPILAAQSRLTWHAHTAANPLSCRVVWAVLHYCTLHRPDGAADDAALAALNLLALGLQHLTSAPGGDASGATAGSSGGGGGEAAGPGARPLPPGLVALLEGVGEGGLSPGILAMIQVGII